MTEFESLDPREIARYSRHLVLPEVGTEGQLRLRAASVLVVGAGGLGCPVAIYLAAAGVGRIGLVDFDAVDVSNLQRQILFATDDVGRPKVVAAAERLRGINPHVEIVPHGERLGADNALEMLRGYDLVVDGTDNFPTRYLINDACVLGGKTNVYGSIFRFEGQVSVFAGDAGPCYRCLYPEPPPAGAVPNCAEGGVLGVLPGIIGTLQATEAIKLLLGRGRSLRGRLLLFDALEMRFRELRLRRDQNCPVCGDAPTIRELVESATACATPPPTPGAAITAVELQRRQQTGRAPVLLDVRTDQEWAICRLDGARLIPLQDLEARLAELHDVRDDEIVVYCHVGMRSAMAVGLLQRHGFAGATNLTGGIAAWAADVEPSMPRY